MSAASEIVPMIPMPNPISRRLLPRSRSTTNPKITLTASTAYPDGSCCIPKSRKADNDTPNAGARAQENRGGASTSTPNGAVVNSTTFKIGVGGHVIAFDPPVRPGAMSINAHPRAIGQATEPSPLIKRQPHESARTHPTRQPVCGDDDSGMIFSLLCHLCQRLGNSFSDLARALPSGRAAYVLPFPQPLRQLGVRRPNFLAK